MACSSKIGLQVSGLNETYSASERTKTKGVLGFYSFGSSQFRGSKANDFPVLSNDFIGKPILVSDQKDFGDLWIKAPGSFSDVRAQASICVSRARRWWEKTLNPNMVEINSAQELVDSLLNADDRLVVIDFYSPGCGGCRTLHPKICQLAESNPNAIFLQVNYEELKTMCHSLHIHVLPFFRFYRGAEGRLCSFSCTVSTIKKFKDALAKYGTDRCSLGPAKGLDESELMKLASIGELSPNSPLPFGEDGVENLVMKGMDVPVVWSNAGNKLELQEESAMLKI